MESLDQSNFRFENWPISFSNFIFRSISFRRVSSIPGIFSKIFSSVFLHSLVICFFNSFVSIVDPGDIPSGVLGKGSVWVLFDVWAYNEIFIEYER